MSFTTLKWDRRFLELAALIGSWSKDPSTKVGAVIVRPDRTIASTGYNGFPRRTDDDPALLEDREVKYARIVHAEVNAIVHASEDLSGHTLYTTPFPPCDRCAGIVIQSGITRVVYPSLTEDVQRWSAAFQTAQQLFDEAGIQLTEVAV